MYVLIIFTNLLVIARALLSDPGEFALVLSEDDFEDYLDEWLAQQEQQKVDAYSVGLRSGSTGCQIRVNGDLGQPQPLYVRRGDYIVPAGNTGLIPLNTGEEVTFACTGSKLTISQYDIDKSIAIASGTCVSGNLINIGELLEQDVKFGDILCSDDLQSEAQETSNKCFNNNIVIRVGYVVDNVFLPLYWSCFDQNRLEVLYVWYDQNPANAVHQSKVARPEWLAGNFYPGVEVNTMYTHQQQKGMIAEYVGQENADRYVTNSQFLSRGHLAAKTDFIFATGQRATFYFINIAPQWQPFNAGNWNWLEQNLRSRIAEAGYNTRIYTGTFGITQLRDADNKLVDIYLYRDAGGVEKIPVPLYYYKVVYDASRGIGTAFVGVNNPYYTEAEVRGLQFCTDRCRNNPAFGWLKWQPDRIDIGYSFCCTVDDFRRTVPHLPSFVVNGLLS